MESQLRFGKCSLAILWVSCVKLAIVSMKPLMWHVVHYENKKIISTRPSGSAST